MRVIIELYLLVRYIGLNPSEIVWFVWIKYKATESEQDTIGKRCTDRLAWRSLCTRHR